MSHVEPISFNATMFKSFGGDTLPLEKLYRVRRQVSNNLLLTYVLLLTFKTYFFCKKRGTAISLTTRYRT